jgi:hypothetical protein
MDYVLDYMKKRGIPETRENYLKVAYPEGVPDFDAELEANLPEHLQKLPSKEK